MDDEDAPPELVDVSEQPFAAPSTTVQDTPVQQRVPITLVTGMAGQARPDQTGLKRKFELTESYRVSGRRKDDTSELHPDGEAWQEDCGDHE